MISIYPQARLESGSLTRRSGHDGLHLHIPTFSDTVSKPFDEVYRSRCVSRAATYQQQYHKPPSTNISDPLYHQPIPCPFPSLAFQWLKRALPPPRPNWSPDDIPDLSGKVALVTGGNTGIGRETVKALLRKNAKVYLAARSPTKARKAIEELAAETGGKTAHFLQLDLSDLSAVRDAAHEFARRESRLDILFLNAGIMCPPADQLTAQGYDLMMGTNIIGHFLLLRLLYPCLLPSSRPHSKPRKLGTFAMYAQSKLVPVALSPHIASRGEPVVSIAVDPGHTTSEIFHRDKAWYWRVWDYLVTYPTPYGSITPLYAGTAPEAAAYNGKYLRPWARPGRPNPSAYDAKEQQKLWDWLERQLEPYMTCSSTEVE
ncbi:hypothetical protein C8Q76DRAFT_862721 [Earliella scabrosa]|nr:hypothetical protein C8Q76DRAFT_862721 [Earliella scabrosa]